MVVHYTVPANLDNDRSSYEAAVAALMSPLHQATDKDSLEKSAARRVKTVADMRNYWGRIQWGSDGTAPPPKQMIHITGTKGKGSTACLCQAILQIHGYSTGLFTSPHLMDIRERIRLDGRPIHHNIFAKAYWKIRNDLEAYDPPPNHDVDDLPRLPGYFRMLTLMAFYVFSRVPVDVWIIEVGMGGRYDATNFLDRDSILERSICGVTLLDFDHTRILGNTLELIAWEKGGIFAVDKAKTTDLTPKPDESLEPGNSPVNPSTTSDTLCSHYILDSNTEGALQVFQQCAMNEGCGGILKLVDAKGAAVRQALGNTPLGLAGEHQYGNANLAVHLCHEAIATKNGGARQGSLSVSELLHDTQTLYGLTHAQWPARCQTVRTGGSPFTFRLDGAHTPQSLTATMQWFTHVAEINPRRVLVFNCSHERNPVELLYLLKHGGFTAVYFAKPDSTRPSPVSQPTARELLEEANMEVRQDWISSVLHGAEKETWQETLGILWKHVMASVTAPPSELAAHNHRHTQHYSIHMTCNKRASEILHDLTTNSIQPTEVLVTGSLYIVGSFLTALDWKEEGSPDRSDLLD